VTRSTGSRITRLKKLYHEGTKATKEERAKIGNASAALPLRFANG